MSTPINPNVNQNMMSNPSRMSEHGVYIDQQANLGMPMNQRMHPMMNMNQQGLFPGQQSQQYGIPNQLNQPDFGYGQISGNGMQQPSFFPHDYMQNQQPNPNIFGFLIRYTDEFFKGQESQVKK